MKGLFYFPLILIGILALALFFIRFFSARHLDDVTPGIPCNENLLIKADVYFIIPNFEGNDISKNETWVKKIILFNKTLALHGVTHEYEEFLTYRNEEYLQEGLNIFEQAFGFFPKRFKPPQLAISANNIRLISNAGMKIDYGWKIIFHKVYHCNDTGIIPNWLVNLV